MCNDIERTVEQTFQQLDHCLSHALSICPVEDARLLLELVAAIPQPARQLIAGELIKLDMAKASESGQLRRLDFYELVMVDVFPEKRPSLDLVLEEIQVCRELGHDPSLSDYRLRFPHLAASLLEILPTTKLVRQQTTDVKPTRFQSQEVVDDFVILRLLGSGAFADVYLAKQPSMARLVALKVSGKTSDEPQALSQLDHTNIVRVYDQRQLGDSPVHLLYMEYVPGGTLEEVIRATRDLSIKQLDGRSLLVAINQALVVAEQQRPDRSLEREQLANVDWSNLVARLGVGLAEGIDAAHRRGIMHRDIKPANILLSASGVPKLADFNVSFGNLIGRSNAAAHFGGSLAYMSPEQICVADPSHSMQAGDLDPRSDLFSLGVVLWELWQGHRPQTQHEPVVNWMQALQQQLTLRRMTPQRHRQFPGAAARVLEKILRQTLEFDREARPRSGAELAARLMLVLHPQAAELFEPAPRSWRKYMLATPVLLTTSLIIFIPNGLAGAINYQYNFNSIQTLHPQLLTFFETLSRCINWVAFPLGGLLLLYFSWPVEKVLRGRETSKTLSSFGLHSTWQLGHYAAMVGGLLWWIAGVVFPTALRISDDRFGLKESIEFFLSLAICGGLAWIYPFFGIALVAVEVYYPALVSKSMLDFNFEDRAKRMQRQAAAYLFSAAAIPLLALALMALVPSANEKYHTFLLVMVILAGVALPFAFLAYQRLIKRLAMLRTVLADHSFEQQLFS
jgi:serine/threonine protein kinase